MKYLVTLLLIAGTLVMRAQLPYSEYKNGDIYSISVKELAGDSSCSITTIDSMTSPGGMNEYWDINVLTISKNGGSDYWYIPSRFENKKGKRYPTSEPADKDFLNGIEWQVEDGRIISSEFVGYGTGCRSEYYYDSTLTRVVKTEHCKFDTVECVRSVVVFSGGRPSFIINPPNACFDMNNETKDLPLYGPVTGDTTALIYDAQGTMRGMYVHDSVIPLYEYHAGKISIPSSYHRIMINGIAFEKFVEQRIKFLPKCILIETWKYGVYIYRYDEGAKMYYTDRKWELY